MRSARGNGRKRTAPLRSQIPASRPTPHTRATQPWRRGTAGEGAADTFPKLPAPPPPPHRPRQKGKQKNRRGDRRKDSTLRVKGWELPLPPGEVKPLAAPPTSNPPTQPFKPLSPPRYLPLLRAYHTGSESWQGVGRERSGESYMRASLRGGGERIPGEVVWRGLWAQAQGVAPPPSLTPPSRSPLDPRGRSTCRGSPGSPAARERTRAPHPSALPRTRARSHPRWFLTHFKVHSQNSQTFSARRG